MSRLHESLFKPAQKALCYVTIHSIRVAKSAVKCRHIFLFWQILWYKKWMKKLSKEFASSFAAKLQN
jgi:hypothetical protein